MNLGGTGDPPVLGGNLPPSLRQENIQATMGLPGGRRAAGASPAATGQWPVPPGSGGD
jgi:hypothetical protein